VIKHSKGFADKAATGKKREEASCTEKKREQDQQNDRTEAFKKKRQGPSDQSANFAHDPIRTPSGLAERLNNGESKNEG